ncbi:uncharacterized protein LOC110263237 [Arachis ipaensis]|uniref:uncharacterized protein LOC110263237 n=1 Tax=Arachis ipaensis TaxID=130454 RepID=UPI000A2B7968|nr:uncharacterized protein LOC110263237 [Arachis ipaensis]
MICYFLSGYYYSFDSLFYVCESCVGVAEFENYIATALRASPPSMILPLHRCHVHQCFSSDGTFASIDAICEVLIFLLVQFIFRDLDNSNLSRHLVNLHIHQLKICDFGSAKILR